MKVMISLQLFLAGALALALDHRQAGPSVVIQNGTVVGSSLLGIDSFKGIPFAQPPVGNLRLRPPQSINKPFGTFQATGSPRACPQFFIQLDTGGLPDDVVRTVLDSPLFQEVTNAGEDCLTINVQRPSSATRGTKLPVLFWIYGGAFQEGSTSTYDGTSIVQKSISLGQPIIYVSVNYRVGGFGFLAGKELADEHSTNLGLRDQRLGLQWVAENIAAFGGDPDKVTIWGESAGSMSVFDHTVINGGDNTYRGKPLFRGGIMDSGCMIPALDVKNPKPQKVYDTVVENAGCSGASDTLACLRSKDYTTFLNAVNALSGILTYRSVDIPYLPRPDPGDSFYSESAELSLNAGRFSKVPIIIGDQEDEGTLFSLMQSNITNNDQLVDYLVSYFPSNPNSRSDVQKLVATYPDQPLIGQPAGSPFGTGPLYNIYPEFKRLAAILGDIITFTLTRRVYLSLVSSQVTSYSYLSSYLHGLPIVGTFHASDLLFAYGLAGSNEITDTIQKYYISFVNHLDPNALGTPAPMIPWPNWNATNPQLVNLLALSNQLITDDFRQDSYEYLRANLAPFRV